MISERAVVGQMEARLKLRKTEERMVAEGGVSGLQLAARRLGAGGAVGGAPRWLLAPATLSLALAQPPGQGMHVEVALTDIKITVSPGQCPAPSTAHLFTHLTNLGHAGKSEAARLGGLWSLVVL